MTMRFFVWPDDTGLVVRSAALPLNVASGAPPTGALETARYVPAGSAFVADGAVHPLPPQPSIEHVFDPAKKDWHLPAERAWASVRAQRDALLAACDWVTLRAQETGTPVPPEWLAYRQALRDVTKQADPQAISWPAAPG